MVEFETIVNPPQEVFDQLVDLSSKTENWTFQYSDYKLWLESYNQFWLVTVVEKGTNNFVASVSLARCDENGDSLYAIGMYYCVEKYRDRGFGKPIFQKVVDIIGDVNATLTGAVKMSAKYAKVFGFDKMPPFWHHFSTLNISDVVLPNGICNEYIITDLQKLGMKSLNIYDRSICIRDREKFITGHLNQKNTFTKIVLNKSNDVVGYCTLRVVSNGRLIAAPFYCDTPEAAEVLLKASLKGIADWQKYSSLSFIYPEINKDVLCLLQRFAKRPELVVSKQFMRIQFTKKFINSPDQKVYSVSDFAHQFV